MSDEERSEYWEGVAAAYEVLLSRRGRASETALVRLLWWAYAMLPPSALTDPRAREIAELLGRGHVPAGDQMSADEPYREHPLIDELRAEFSSPDSVVRDD